MLLEVFTVWARREAARGCVSAWSGWGGPCWPPPRSTRARTTCSRGTSCGPPDWNKPWEDFIVKYNLLKCMFVNVYLTICVLQFCTMRAILTLENGFDRQHSNNTLTICGVWCAIGPTGWRGRHTGCPVWPESCTSILGTSSCPSRTCFLRRKKFF